MLWTDVSPAGDDGVNIGTTCQVVTVEEVEPRWRGAFNFDALSWVNDLKSLIPKWLSTR